MALARPCPFGGSAPAPFGRCGGCAPLLSWWQRRPRTTAALLLPLFAPYHPTRRPPTGGFLLSARPRVATALLLAPVATLEQFAGVVIVAHAPALLALIYAAEPGRYQSEPEAVP